MPTPSPAVVGHELFSCDYTETFIRVMTEAAAAVVVVVVVVHWVYTGTNGGGDSSSQ